MLSGLSVKNIRALRDSGEIAVKKLNILVGMNSSGKSTLLRLFPLLRQSVEVRTKGPILWYGRLVDFGSLAEVKSAGSSNSPVTLTLSIEPVRRLNRQSRFVVKVGAFSYRLPRTLKLTLEIDKGSNDSGFVSRVGLLIAEDAVSIHYTANQVKLIEINGFKFEPSSDQLWLSYSDSKVPGITYMSKKTGEGAGQYYSEDQGWLAARIVSHLKGIAHGNISKEKLALVANELGYTPLDEFRRQLANLTTAPDSLRFDLLGRDMRDTYLSVLRALLLLRALPDVMKEVGERFHALGKGVRYIEPLRASVERYYRLQDLAVDEIDSSGANTAMYLHSLSRYDKDRLRKWMIENLNFHAFTEVVGGNVEIKIVIGSEILGRNVTDLGFGYSQVLPVVLQLWHSYVRAIGRLEVDPTVVAIEQPELHLHPRYQALLADVFARVATGGEKSQKSVAHIPMFVETHSEHIVNRLGSLVAQGVIDRDDVQVLLFEREDGVTSVKSVGFDSDGILGDSWPLGFFVPEA